MTSERNCFEIASAGNPAYFREFCFPYDDKTFVVKVCTPLYLRELEARNTGRPDDAKIDKRIITFPDVALAEELGRMTQGEICRRLNQIPPEALRPYLVEQITDPVGTEGLEPPTSSM